jgi:hypothetical protein
VLAAEATGRCAVSAVEPRKRKPRGPNLFRQRDVQKAIKAAFAAGAQTVRIQVGGVTVLADREQSIHTEVTTAPSEANEWDCI